MGVTAVAMMLLMHSGIVLADSDGNEESFEGFTAGTAITNYAGWGAAESNSVIVSTNYYANYVGGAFPITSYNHNTANNVLKIENGVSNTVAQGRSSVTNWVDTVLNPVYSDDEPAAPEAGALAGVYFNTNGHPVVMHTISNDANNVVWVEIPEVTVSEDEWIRLTIAVDFKAGDGDAFYPFYNSTRMYQVAINGTPLTNAAAFFIADRNSASGGSWFGNRAALARTSPVTNVIVQGTGYMDDLVYTNSLTLVQPEPTFIDTVPTVGNTIYYGQTLADVSLVGGSATNDMGNTVAGTFAFTTPVTAPPVGTNSYQITFTPTPGPTNYLTDTAFVDVVTVKAATYVDTLPTVSALTEGDTLADAGLTGGTATNILGQQIPGTYAFELPTSTVPPVGTNAYNVIFTATDPASYLTTTGQVDIVVTGTGGGTTTNGTPTTWYDDLGITTNVTYPTYDDLDGADSDGDGVLNWREYISGTLPNDSNSVFRVLSISGTPPNVDISFIGGTNGPVTPYIVWGAPSLEADPIAWTVITNQARVEGTNTVTGANVGSNLYFRVIATP
jgi:hypothetical protein